MMSEVKSFLWHPTVTDFIAILKNELASLNPSGDKVDIPTVRSLMTKKLGIDEQTFDELLIEAWKKDKIKLEAGAPIGEFDVKYLTTHEGQKFYYIRKC